MSCHYNADQFTNLLEQRVLTVDSDAGELQILPWTETVATSIQELCDEVHFANTKWWVDIKTGQPLPDRNVGEMLMLVVTELAESMEGHRKNLMDDHLPHRKMFEVEIADAIIRLFDIAGGLDLDLGHAFVEKMVYNSVRADHTIENRLKENGKKF